MTKEERRLWYDFLKGLPVTVNRQKVIGRRVADFYCAEAKLVVEIDGTPHYEQNGKEADSERDACLNSIGPHVLRYSNRDINRSFDGVCADIMTPLPTSSASLCSAPFPQGEGKQKAADPGMKNGFPWRESCQRS